MTNYEAQQIRLTNAKYTLNQLRTELANKALNHELTAQDLKYYAKEFEYFETARNEAYEALNSLTEEN